MQHALEQVHDAPRAVPDPGLDAARGTLGRGLNTLGFEIVDVAALLKALDQQSDNVRAGLGDLRAGASGIDAALATASEAVAGVAGATEDSVRHAGESMQAVRDAAGHSRRVAEWVEGLGARIAALEARLGAVEASTARIDDIAREVGILAINARIEAARAGDNGRGFAVVAEAISELAGQTAQVTKGISTEVSDFAAAVSAIGGESAGIVADAGRVLDSGRSTDTALTAIGGHLGSTQEGVQRLARDLAALTAANDAFRPVLDQLAQGITETGEQLHDGQTRVEGLIDLAEELVQANAALGGTSDDGPMIAIVQDRAHRIAEVFAKALSSGAITEEDLFDTSYRPVQGSEPQQVMTRFSAFTDRVLPPIQEPVLSLDARIVFCAAVDRNGYLPTHNAKFSQQPSGDPVWNAAHCRNRRIFDDRVGLKAGRSTAPFLLQVYRRDMGGGQSVLMKDLSAPIMVGGRHWGGLRLAYRPD
ncbi:methyl-accepting chemotaxis protein [Roseibacterium sp. SDUM158016]|uniref:methyl-accepting chemotaxis protein n=1 Tax=Roseicyclus sediminis TaxID=2980997 RepID=UPI0021CF3AE3|nr:methyl-accepting chemotaxis protein [Roseibacterium sp. SDUM158016]MCU4654231.1 methyl-accepting chemotaxis protein [Roseibacterium sp. SDUM158016]